MAATADRRAKPPAATPHCLEPWAHQPPAVAAHRMPVIPVVSPPRSARDRRRPSSHRRGGAGQDVGEETHNGGIERLRVKLMGHLRDAADRLRVPQPTPSLPPPPPETDSELRAPPPPPPPLLPSPPPQLQPSQGADVAVPERPWNLRERTRRRPAAAKSWAASAPLSSSSLRRRRKRAPFSVSLTAEEVEEDIYALTGARPRRRPRKRPRVVQRQLDTLFPGLWLTEVTADAYRVPDE